MQMLNHRFNLLTELELKLRKKTPKNNKITLKMKLRHNGIKIMNELFNMFF